MDHDKNQFSLKTEFELLQKFWSKIFFEYDSCADIKPISKYGS